MHSGFFLACFLRTLEEASFSRGHSRGLHAYGMERNVLTPVALEESVGELGIMGFSPFCPIKLMNSILTMPPAFLPQNATIPSFLLLPVPQKRGSGLCAVSSGCWVCSVSLDSFQTRGLPELPSGTQKVLISIQDSAHYLPPPRTDGFISLDFGWY